MIDVSITHLGDLDISSKFLYMSSVTCYHQKCISKYVNRLNRPKDISVSLRRVVYLSQWFIMLCLLLYCRLSPGQPPLKTWSMLKIWFTTTFVPVQLVPITNKVVNSKSCSWRGLLNTTLCDKVCQLLATDQWFSPGTPFPPPIKLTTTI